MPIPEGVEGKERGKGSDEKGGTDTTHTRTTTEKEWDEGPSGEVNRMDTLVSEALVKIS